MNSSDGIYADTEPERTSTLSVRKKLLFSFASLLIFLAGVELSSRAVIAAIGLPDEQTLRSSWAEEGWAVDSELGWTLFPNGTSMRGGAQCHTNSLGLRGPEVLPQKEPGGVRILSIGDSTVLGFGVAEEETFSRVFGERLEAELGRPVEVINAGVAGYSSEQARIYLERRGLALSPDLVIFESNFNDRRAVPPSGEIDSEAAFNSIYRRLRRRELLLTSAAFRLVARIYRGAPTSNDVIRGGDYSFDEISIDVPPRVSLQRFEENVRAIVSASQEMGAAVILVGLPDNPVVVRDIQLAEAYAAAERWPDAELALIRAQSRRVYQLVSQRILNEILGGTGRDHEIRQTVPVKLQWMSTDGYTPIVLSESYIAVLERVARATTSGFVVPSSDPKPASIYIDYIHLNVRGHALLAEMLLVPALQLMRSG